MRPKLTYLSPNNETESAEPYLQMTWTDPVTGANGYLVIHELPASSRLCTGGTRMRAGCTLEEVKDLAACMNLKATTFELGVGGAKAGIDYDPKAPDALSVLARFMTAVQPWLDAHWVTAEDLGVPQQRIDEVFRSLGLGQSYHAAIQRSHNPEATLERVRSGMSALVDGNHEIGDIAGGYGVAQACLGVIEARGWAIAGTTAAVQGIGTMGGGTAWYLHQAGVTITAVADAQGTLVDKNGLDVPELLSKRDASGEIDRTKIDPGIERGDRDAILSLPVDILVPAATSYVINERVARSVVASVIVEAANAATTPDGEQMLLTREFDDIHGKKISGIPVVPDFVANAGAVVWAWWLLKGEIDADTDATLNKLKEAIHSKAAGLIATWDQLNVMPRVAAKEAAARLAATSGSQPIHIP